LSVRSSALEDTLKSAAKAEDRQKQNSDKQSSNAARVVFIFSDSCRSTHDVDASQGRDANCFSISATLNTEYASAVQMKQATQSGVACLKTHAKSRYAERAVTMRNIGRGSSCNVMCCSPAFWNICFSSGKVYASPPGVTVSMVSAN